MGWHWRDAYRLDEKAALRDAMRHQYAEALAENAEFDRRNGMRVSSLEAWVEIIDIAHQQAIVEDYEREQLLKAEALKAAWEASNHLQTLVEFIGEAPVGSTVLGPEERKLLVEDHGWFRVVDGSGLTNHRGLLATVAYEALMDGRVGGCYYA